MVVRFAWKASIFQMLLIDLVYVLLFTSLFIATMFEFFKLERKLKASVILALNVLTFICYLIRDCFIITQLKVDYFNVDNYGAAYKYIAFLADDLLLLTHYLFIRLYFRRSLLFQFSFHKLNESTRSKY